MVSKIKKDQKHKKIIYLLGAIIVLLIVILFVMFVRQHNNNGSLTTEKGGIHVNLGSYEWDIANDKAVKRTDSKTTELRELLESESKKSLSENCKEIYHWVIGSSADRNQVLLSYGCDNPGARMFAIRDDQGWKLISPTNQFDSLGIPLCSHVDQNNISNDIAPVCYNVTDETNRSMVYKTR